MIFDPIARGGLGLAVVAVAAVTTTSAPAADDDSIERGCRTSVYGELGAWQERSVVQGPLGLVGARAFAARFAPLPAGGGRYRGSKLLVLVRTGWIVRLVVPGPERHRVALQYDPADFNEPVAPVGGDHEVNFAACPPGRPFLGPARERWTQFNGAIVVANRRCARLHVYAARQGRPLPARPKLLLLPFGRRACRA